MLSWVLMREKEQTKKVIHDHYSSPRNAPIALATHRIGQPPIEPPLYHLNAKSVPASNEAIAERAMPLGTRPNDDLGAMGVADWGKMAARQMASQRSAV
jgi:hypothetical protein